MRDSLFCEKQDNIAVESLEPRVRSSTGISTVLLFPFYEPMIKKTWDPRVLYTDLPRGVYNNPYITLGHMSCRTTTAMVCIRLSIQD